MKLPENNSLIAIVVVAVSTVLMQFPAVSHWYGQVSNEHTHIVTIVEGAVGVLLLLFSARKPAPATTAPVSSKAGTP